MAYHVKNKDPFLDHSTHLSLMRRSRELVGIALVVIAVLLALMMISHTPDDPSILAATDTDLQNYLGRFGAFLSMIFLTGIGIGIWALVAAFAVWGVRLIIHTGVERALTCGLFVLPWVMIFSVFASSHVPPDGWSQVTIGLGGLLGDTVLQFVLPILPFTPAIGVKFISLVLVVPVFVLGAVSLGIDHHEYRILRTFLMENLKIAWDRILSSLMENRQREISAPPTQRRSTEQPRMTVNTSDDSSASLTVPKTEGEAQKFHDNTSEPKRGKLFSLLGRGAQSTTPSAEPSSLDYNDANDRIKARISSAIKNRIRRGEPIAPPLANALPDRAASEPEIEEHDHKLWAPLAGFTPGKLNLGRTPAKAPSPPEQKLSLRQEPVLTQRKDPDPSDALLPSAEFADLSDDYDDPYADPAYTPLPEPDDAPLLAEASSPDVILFQPLASRKVLQRPKKTSHPSRQAQTEAQPVLAFEAVERPIYEQPPLRLLKDPNTIERRYLSDEALEENARMLETVLDDYGVKGEIVSVRPGPVVTMYELEPAPGLKASRVIGLADDIARSMSALSARVSTVPGRTIIGIELPNEHREMVLLREILSHRDFGDTTMRLPLALGKDIAGAPVVANLAKMPHLLIAGTTGSGKSVAINTMILSLLYKLTPEDCRLIMIDPKMLELSVYDGIPHLLSPVVTDPKKAVVALKWVVGEMEERYRKMSKMGVRNIDGYNSRVADTLAKGEMFTRTVQTGFDDATGEPIFETEEIMPEKLPFIVVIVDEMADLMMVAGKEIEACIQRLAQMARASGIHLVMATQRPSVDVITGTIKANFPTRISFHVTSKVDSRTILGEQGAEQLLGMGDMLYMSGGSKITRVHGPFCSDEEVEEIVNHLKSFGPPDYAASVLDGPDDEKADDIDQVLGLGGNTGSEDALYDQAVAIVAKDRKCSTSYIQRKLGIGYNKAARLVEQMEDNGLVTSANQVGKRDILIPEHSA